MPIEMIAFIDDGCIALKLPEEMIPKDAERAGATGVLLRFRSAEGFKRFMLHAIETAALVWPEIAQEWKDVGGDDS